LTLDDYAKLSDAQDGCCAICGQDDSLLYVDHDHATQEVRGLLCFHCNTALGHFEDSTANLANAITYLQKKGLG